MSGEYVDISSGGTVASLEVLPGQTPPAGFHRVAKGESSTPSANVAVIPLVASDAAGGAVAWSNPEQADLIIERVILDVTHATTAGTATVDIGIAANGTSSSDTLMDGLSVVAAGTFSNIDSKGTNGKSIAKLAAAEYVTASKASGALAGLTGSLYVTYRPID